MLTERCGFARVEPLGYASSRLIGARVDHALSTAATLPDTVSAAADGLAHMKAIASATIGLTRNAFLPLDISALLLIDSFASSYGSFRSYTGSIALLTTPASTAS